MNDDRTSRWVWRAIEAAAFAAVLFLLIQSPQQVDGLEERVRSLDARLSESAGSGDAVHPASPRPAGDASARDEERLAQRIVALLRAGEPIAPAPQRVAASAGGEATRVDVDADGRIRVAQKVVAEALARGKLEREAVRRLRELQAQSGNDPRFAAIRNEVFTAINQQKLIPEDPAFIAF